MVDRGTLSVELPAALVERAERAVAAGRYADVSAVIAAGLETAASSARYRAICESAAEYAIIAFDLAGRITEWNLGAAEITGWSAEEMLGQDGALIFTPEDQVEGVPAREMRLAAENGRAVNERWHVKRGGGRFWGSGLMMPLHDDAGALAGYLKIMQDRTAQHDVGRALEDSEAQLAAIFDAAPIGILVAEAPSGRLVRANRQVDRLFGAHWPRAQSVAEYGAWECFHADGRRVLADEYPMARALLGETRPQIEVLRRTDSDGRHWVRLTGAPIVGAGGRIDGALVSIEDIDLAKRFGTALETRNEALEQEATDRASELQGSRRDLVGAEARREVAEGQVRQLQKMEAVGQLTGGIAHDFNNMLAVVMGGLNLVQRRLARGDHNVDRFVEAAMDGARRAATLTQRLLAFSRQQPLAPVALDVNGMVRGMEDLLRRTLGEAVMVETVMAAGLWRSHADPSQLENALLNLAVNGRDAMDGVGRLTIETANSFLDDAYAQAHNEVAPGQYVLVAVTDSGGGMAPDVAARAFEPFFTTKAAGAGTGLGLSQVYGFVKQSGGHLKIYSEMGQGTTVKIYLPRFAGQTEAIPSAAVPDIPSLGRFDEIVLVVEDEDRVRELAVASLRELGYSVLHAPDAAAALRQLDAHPDVTLMFTDIVMPGVNGRKLADEACRRRPTLKVLFTTGYTRNAVVHNGVLDAGVDLLGKPYTVEQLAAKVRSVLDRK